ncbi:hypothetical protein D9M70_475660 [compost metagenome]
MHPAIVASLALQCAIQARPALQLHFALQGPLDLQIGARPQPFGRQFGGPVAETMGDVVTRDDEVLAGVVAPAQDDVDVRVVGIPMIHRHPVQARAQVGFHAPHQVPGVGAQVVQLGTVFWRDDEAEMVPVVLAALLECTKVGLVRLRPIGPPRLAIAAGAVALDVAQVLGQRPWAGLALVDQQGLDSHSAREWCEQDARETRRRVPAPQARAGPLTGVLSLATGQCWVPHSRLATGLADLLEHLGDKALAPVLRGVGPNAEIVVTPVGHGCSLVEPGRVLACEAHGYAGIGACCASRTARRRSRAVPLLPHVQTGVAGEQVPPPFVLPSAFALPCPPGLGGQAALLHQQPACLRMR